MIAVIDYGVGNLFSLRSSFDVLGAETVVTGEADVIMSASGVVLPGVGAYGDAIDKLRSTGLDRTVKDYAGTGRPVLGICLGMQLLFDVSYEYGEHRGLGLIGGEVRAIADMIPHGLKVPHMGWNALELKRPESRLMKYIHAGDFVYFVHSFAAVSCDSSVIATAEYGVPLTAAVTSGNVYGCQFHPEKSGEVGLSILKAFCEMGEA